jgi:trimeric autotransporter adhesin
MTQMQRTLSSLTILLSLAGVAGCSDSSSSGNNKLVAEGRVEGNLDESTTTVRAYVVTDSGEREPVAMEPTATDGSGNYRIESTVELSTGSHVLIEATDGTNEAAVVFLVEADGEVNVEPMTEETSFEAAVFQSLSASTSCEDCTLEAIRTSIEAEAAATFASGEQSAATLEGASSALEARIEAEATVLRGESESAYNAYVSARAEAQADEVAALHAATSASATAEAHADFDAALAEARSSSSLDASVWASSAHAGAEALRLEATDVSLDAAIYAQLVADAEMERAHSVQASMEAELEASGATDVNLDATFVTLTAAIEAARNDGAAAGETIAAAWTTAAVSIRAEISGSLDTTGSAAFDTWASFSATLVATLRADALLEGSASVDTAVLFARGLGEASVDVAVLTTAGISADQANAFASILLHAELAATAE